MGVDPSMLLGAGSTLIGASWVLLMWCYRKTLYRLWSEPVLRHPVLIIESDDWGSGPALHAERLSALADMLQSHRDAHGRHPVMTLGVVLAVPDTATLRETGLRRYAQIALDDARCQAILQTMRRGQDAEVFAIQLHGMEHFWLPSLMESANHDLKIRHWLTSDPFPATENLPSHLQSRWVDGSTLPSAPLSQDQIEAAVKEEMTQFRRVFGFHPQVVVPPTFVWTKAVENAWLDNGIRVIVTPGRRYTCRDGRGKPAGIDRVISNGQRIGERGVYLVRDDYFEPSLGHTARQAFTALERKVRVGRPALLETHRFNFTGEDFRRSLEELDCLLAEALRALPGLRFMSTEELARAYSEVPSSLFEKGKAIRIHVWLRRLQTVSRLYKLAWLCGLALPAASLLWITASRSFPRSPARQAERAV